MRVLPIVFAAPLLVSVVACGPKWKESGEGDIKTVVNEGGPTLRYSSKSAVTILTDARLGFKDLNKNGQLDAYEDWRLSVDERAKDLASKMSVEQIAGLMLYSRHQAIPAPSSGFRADTYNGKPLAESGLKASDVSDGQKKFLVEDNLRHILVTSVESPLVAAEWNNNVQALAESIGLGIPANNSSDPRNGTTANAEFNEGSGGSISMWPGSLGLAATFDPQVTEEFGRIASIEYRALGITTALSPQVDMASDPRWNRVPGTFGEHPYLAADMARAYVDGFQSSSPEKEIKDGWGYESVNAMVKHWPGGGSGEGGRDAHYGFGKYAVYPGNNFDMHLIPFTEGAFKLRGKTGVASALMPYYTVSYDQDKANQENVGNAYNKYLINDLLREKYQYDGVVCTDWGVTGNETAIDVFLTGKSWGVEGLSLGERHYKVLMAGGDQFGGNNDKGPVMEAYQLGVKEHGEEFMRQRFEQSAVRLLKNIFRPGLFEDPYLDVEASTSTVGKAEFMKAGYAAQLKSIVMVKNAKTPEGTATLPLATGKKVYIPKKFTPAGRNFLGVPIPETLEYPVSLELVKKYFEVTDNPAEADFAIAFIGSPNSGLGYEAADAKNSNGYVPISLQFGEYQAKEARDPSIAGGDPLEKFTNRTYKGKKSKAINITDLGMVNDTKKKMGSKPVVVVMMMNNPAVFGEFEPQSAAILIHFGVQYQAIFDMLTGKAEPSALLPLQMPANMVTVEKQAEDVPLDMEVYGDSDGNKYDFGFGLNWKGVITDERTQRYSKTLR